MKTSHDKKEEKAVSVAVFLVVGVIIILVGAFLHAAHISFFLIAIAIGAFCFFIVFTRYNRDRVDFQSPTAGLYAKPRKNWMKDFANVFQRQVKSQNGNMKSFNRRVFVLVFFSGLVMFFMILFFTLDSTEVDVEKQKISDTGDQFYWSAEYDSAYLYYKRAARIDPLYARAYCGLGNVMFTRKQYDSALFYYDEALRIQPDFDQAAYGKAWVFYDQKKYAQTIREARGILRRNENHQDAYLLAGDCYYLQQQYDSALAFYEPAYAQGARSKELCHIMAFIYDKRGEMDQAVSFYEETLKYDSTSNEVYRRLAEISPEGKKEFYRKKTLNW